ncbi:mitochondrial import inner membrane translocase subunit TIM50-C [Cotesia typhae]|uniref:mitochondrial import inner membrane translocase subunit TIM50-C n=1 Tax=Cotesia typhae TaxID=2053667 RepID=UPI003D695643
MAFATRNYRIFCKLYNSNLTANRLTLRKSDARINILPSIQKCEFHKQTDRSEVNASVLSESKSPLDPILKDKQDGHQGSGSSHDNIGIDEEELRRRENSWKYTKWSLVAMGLSFGIGGGFFIYETSLPQRDELGNIIEDEYSDMSFIPRTMNRVLKRLQYYTEVIQNPMSDKLLPDNPYPFQPIVVVLELNDVLVHPEWTYETGWRFKKRPGLDLFLDNLSQYFELVIYTSQPQATIAPVLASLDPKGVAHKLMREATRFIDGCHIKDLNALNRDLKKIIVVDWNPSNVKLHPDNLFKIPRWDGNDDDTTLFYLASFLKTVGSLDIVDVRDVLVHYQQYDDPVAAFTINQQNLMKKMEEEEIMKKKSESSKSLISRWSPGFNKPLS